MFIFLSEKQVSYIRINLLYIRISYNTLIPNVERGRKDKKIIIIFFTVSSLLKKKMLKGVPTFHKRFY